MALNSFFALNLGLFTSFFRESMNCSSFLGGSYKTFLISSSDFLKRKGELRYYSFFSGI